MKCSLLVGAAFMPPTDLSMGYSFLFFLAVPPNERRGLAAITYLERKNSLWLWYEHRRHEGSSTLG